MKKLIIIIGLFCAFGIVGYSQQGDGQRDPKVMTARAAEKLDFTAEQKEKLTLLNKKYSGEDYDRKKYRDEFRQIMTDEQRQKADMMKERQKKKAQKAQ